MNRIVALVCLILAGLGITSSVSAQLISKEPLDRIVAIAEDDVILQSDLDRAVANVIGQYRKQSAAIAVMHDVLEKQVLESLDHVASASSARAQSTGIRVSDADVDQAMQRVAENNKISVQQLRASLAQQGMDFDEFRKSLREQLMVQRLQQRVVQSQAIVSILRIDILLASNSLKEGELHLQHILINLPEGATAPQIQQAKEKADDVEKQIADGMDFTAATIRYSSAPDALNGGDLGWRHFDEVPEAFANLVEGMQPGQVSQPVRGPSGYHIVKLVDKRIGGKQVVTEYNARHIMIKIGELTSSDEAKKTVTDLRHRIVDNHEDFAALAKKYSQDVNTAQGGGDLGWFQIDQFRTRTCQCPRAFGRTTKFCKSFQTCWLWHIMQRLGTRQQDLTDTMKARTCARRNPQSQIRRGVRQLPASGAQRIWYV